MWWCANLISPNLISLPETTISNCSLITILLALGWSLDWFWFFSEIFKVRWFCGYKKIVKASPPILCGQDTVMQGAYNVRPF